MKLLLAMDDSPHSLAALESVLSRPWPSKTQFKLISVVEPFHPEYAGWHTSYVPLALDAQKEVLDTTRNLVQESSKRLAEKFGAENVSFQVLEGYIKDAILDMAREWPADLIVMGSHGRRGFTKFLLGSVSEAVVSHAACSVEIVRMKNPEVQNPAAAGVLAQKVDR